MRFGLDVAQHQLTWAELLERVRFAEESGFDGAWVFDQLKTRLTTPRHRLPSGESSYSVLTAGSRAA